MLWAGLEGGGTHSTYVLLSHDGAILGRSTGPGTNPWLVSKEEWVNSLLRMHQSAVAAAGLTNYHGGKVTCAGLGLCVSGLESFDQKLLYVEALKSSGHWESFQLGNDCTGSALTAHTSGGCVLIAGTGRACRVVMNKNGVVSTPVAIGGWGHLLGDEGSAYDTTTRALKLLLHRVEGDFLLVDPNAPTALSTDSHAVLEAEALSFFKVSTLRDLIPLFYGESRFNKSAVANFCKEVCYLAMAGDPLSAAIIHETGVALGRQAVTAAKRIVDLNNGSLSVAPLTILCVGSVWKSWSLMKAGFLSVASVNGGGDVEKLGVAIPRRLNPSFKLVRLTETSAIGAAVFAGCPCLPVGVTEDLDSWEIY